MNLVRYASFTQSLISISFKREKSIGSISMIFRFSRQYFLNRHCEVLRSIWNIMIDFSSRCSHSIYFPEDLHRGIFKFDSLT